METNVSVKADVQEVQKVSVLLFITCGMFVCQVGPVRKEYLLFLRLNEFVVLYRHLAAQSLTGVCCRAVGVDEVGSCITDSRGLNCAEKRHQYI